MHAIKETNHDEQDQQQEKVGDKSHTKGSFMKTRAQHACMPLDVAHEWPHTLGSSIDDDLLGVVTALFGSD